jgi:hypothetical protein
VTPAKGKSSVEEVDSDSVIRQYIVVAMAQELVALLDELHATLVTRLSDRPEAAQLAGVACDRAADIVDAIREQVRW